MIWNKVTWYSKLIALILFVALPFIGFYLGIQYGENLQLAKGPTSTGIGGTSGASTVAGYYSNTGEWQTATMSQGDAGFSIAYPIDFNIDQNYSPAPTSDWRLGANGTNGLTFIAITIPSAFEPQTNFADAKLTVGASGSNAALADCLTEDATAIPGTASPATTSINGIQFTVFNSADAGAGNYYQTTSYRTTHAGECWAVEYTIHSAQIGNYPSSYNLHPFDQATLTDVLGRIVGTFRFQ